MIICKGGCPLHNLYKLMCIPVRLRRVFKASITSTKQDRVRDRRISHPRNGTVYVKDAYHIHETAPCTRKTRITSTKRHRVRERRKSNPQHSTVYSIDATHIYETGQGMWTTQRTFMNQCP